MKVHWSLLRFKMHRFYYELEHRCNDRDRIINNIRSYKRSIKIIDAELTISSDIRFNAHRINQRTEFANKVNDMINDLKNKCRIINRYFTGQPAWRSKKTPNELERIKLILSRAKEILPADVLIYEAINK